MDNSRPGLVNICLLAVWSSQKPMASASQHGEAPNILRYYVDIAGTSWDMHHIPLPPTRAKEAVAL